MGEGTGAAETWPWQPQASPIRVGEAEAGPKLYPSNPSQALSAELPLPFHGE